MPGLRGKIKAAFRSKKAKNVRDGKATEKEEGVVAGAAKEEVVVAGKAKEEEAGKATEEVVVAGKAKEEEAGKAKEEGVVAGAAKNGVVAGTAKEEGVVVVKAKEEVVGAGAAKEEVVVVAGAEICQVCMPKEMMLHAIERATEAIKKFTVEKDIARYLKYQMEDKYKEYWHCVVGRNFGSHVSHEVNHAINFRLGEFEIFLFKSGGDL